MYTPSTKENEKAKFKSIYNIHLYKNERKIELHDKTKKDIPGPGTYRAPSDFGYLLPTHSMTQLPDKFSHLNLSSTIKDVSARELPPGLGGKPSKATASQHFNISTSDVNRTLGGSASIPVLPPARLKLKTNVKQTEEARLATSAIKKSNDRIKHVIKMVNRSKELPAGKSDHKT